MGAQHLFFRSHYSLLRGCLSPQEVCHFAAQQGISTVGMADVNNFYGLIDFLRAAEREGVRPVAGVSVETGGRSLLTACVMNRRGYGRICAVLTELLTDTTGAYDPVADFQENGWEGLSLLSPHPDTRDLIASSIIRPAANKYIQTFVKRLHGAAYAPMHPLIESTLADTFGVMVYQEDVSRVAIALAGFPIVDDGWAFLIFGRVEDDLGAVAISVERLVTISRRSGTGDTDRGLEAAVAPERPPLFVWGRHLPRIDTGDAGAEPDVPHSAWFAEVSTGSGAGIARGV